MNSILLVGLILFIGFVFGEVAEKCKLPKISGYILAGILLNPRLTPLVPDTFPEHTDLITDIALAFITFSVGGTLLLFKIKRLGRTILSIAVLEAELALVLVVAGFIGLHFLFGSSLSGLSSQMFLPLSILLGSLALPTDPSATLAVAHEYKAHGDVSSTVMGVAAFDDALGIINYSICIAVAKIMLTGSGFNWVSAMAEPAGEILGGILLGVAFGLVFNQLSGFLRRETEGAVIVIVAATLMLCFGCAKLVSCDELLATMAMGCVVANQNPIQDKIFRMMERYTEELIFVLFFTLSGMHLMFSAVYGVLALIAAFFCFRVSGKLIGSWTGAWLSGAPDHIRRYTGLCLIPQGGIVIGLALSMRGMPEFQDLADALIGIVIGAVVIHEIVGPFLAKTALVKSGEIE